MHDEIIQFMIDHTKKMRAVEEALDQAWWEASRTGSEAAGRRVGELTAEMRRYYASAEGLEQVRTFLATADLPERVRRELVLILHRYQMNQVAPEMLEALARAEADIEMKFNTFRAEFEGRHVSDNDLREVLHLENDIARRQRAWDACKEVGAAVAPDVLELVRARNREARQLGFRDFYAMSLALKELDETDMFRVLDQLKQDSEAPFRALKARLDRSLRRRFDLSDDAPLYPWHYGDPFFQEVPAGTDDEPDLDVIFAHKDLLGMSRAFFGALGLEIDEILEVSDLYEREGKCQHAFSTRLNRDGDARILVNLRNSEKWASTLLHELGHAVYDRYIDLSLPWMLRAPAHMLYTEAVALFMGRFTKDPHWLARYAGLDSPAQRDIVAHAGREARDSQLIFARWGLVMIYFERELYRDPEQDLNGLWWRLVHELQGVTPPPGRNAPDWAAKIHLATTPVYYQNYVIGELVASQMVHHLRNALLEDSPAPDEALISDARVGTWFVERVFRPGSLREWNASLEFATGEPLNPRYFATQFLTADA